MRTRLIGPSISLAGGFIDSITNAIEENEPQVLEARVHDAAVTGVNATPGAWVNFESSSDLPASEITRIQLTQTHGEPLEIGYGPNAGSVTRVFITNRGEGPQVLGVSIPASSKLWIRSLDQALAAGLTTINLMGQP